MDQRRAFLFLGLVILFWTIFWNTGFRRWAVWQNAKNPDSGSKVNAAARGMLIAI